MSDTCQQLRDSQRQSTKFYNSNGGMKLLMELQVGDAAHINTRQGWVPVVVARKLSTPRLYPVTTANSRSYHRNRGQVRKSPPEPVTILPPPHVGELNIPLEEAQSTVDMAPTPPSSAENSTQFPQPPSCRSQSARALLQRLKEYVLSQSSSVAFEYSSAGYKVYFLYFYAT